MHWRGVFTAVGLALAIAACGQRDEEQQPAGSAVGKPALATVPGVALSDARIQLPVVAGRPGVAYFTVSQSSGAPRKIVGISVEMAGKVEMHQTMSSGSMSSMKPLGDVPLEPGKTLKFEPGGYHAMLFDLDPKLRFQDAVKLGVALDDGSNVEASAKVTTAGDGLEHPH